MELEDAREIAKYVLPRFFKKLEVSFPELFRTITHEEKLNFFRNNWSTIEQALAEDVQWAATGIEQKNHPTQRYV
ncbi:MAG: hypothetical protein HYS15_03665 [Candidatus Spechtbacteria bacterium]|nr:hypothetical protein [Candidatus Spechtbacteria bacterium]